MPMRVPRSAAPAWACGCATPLRSPRARAGMFRIERPSERVAILRMDDGKVNAMGPDFVQAFPKAWADATADGRAVVLAGNAKAFCAGLDLKRLPTLEAAELEGFARAF